MKQSSISIIIPVYNAEKYLKQCLDSIVCQVFKDFEVILVNDGSSDGSAAICNEYVQNDSRFKVIHKENGGVSSARNVGLDNAKGEWIAFIDSDDYISEDYFKVFDKNNNSDLILLNIDRLTDYKTFNYLSFENFDLIRNDFLSDHILYPHFPGPWGKFYKLQIIREYNISFNENLHFGEDALFNLEYITHAKRISSFNQSTYIYRDVVDGLSKSKVNLKDDEYLYNSIRKALSKFDEKFYSKNIIYPLSRILLSIYCTKQFNTKEKQKKLSELINEEFEAFMYLYRKSNFRYLVKVCHYFNHYYFLNLFFIRKITS